MKLREVGIDSNTRTLIKSHEFLNANYKSLLNDFDKTYGSNDMKLSEAELVDYKGTLFFSFCSGALIAVQAESEFRKNFNLPKRVLDEISKPRIALPDKKIIM